jgi:hypothetical protein
MRQYFKKNYAIAFFKMSHYVMCKTRTKKFSVNLFFIFELRSMKTLIKKTLSEPSITPKLTLFTRAKVGTHLGIVLDEGKANSLIIGITHAKTLQTGIPTIDCDFCSLIKIKKPLEELSKPEIFEKVKKTESRAILTIVDNNTMQPKNQKQLYKLMASTGLIQKNEQDLLITKILLNEKFNYLANKFDNQKNYILYQTKNKAELVSIEDSERLTALLGLKLYEKHFGY